MSMYRSFESTQNYRPLLYPPKTTIWTILWWAFGIPIICAVAMFGIAGVVMKYTNVGKVVPPALIQTVSPSEVENRYLKIQITNYQTSLMLLTNKIDAMDSNRLELLSLCQTAIDRATMATSNQITLTEENSVLRTENAILLKKIQTTNQ